jgi:hypothetical protein
MNDPVGSALHELVPDPPRELTMDRLTAARGARRRRTGLAAAGAALATAAAALPLSLVVRSASGPAPAFGPSGSTTVVAGVSFRHPAEWRRHRTKDGSVVRLSTKDQVGQGCTVVSDLFVCSPGYMLDPGGADVWVERYPVPPGMLTSSGFQVREIGGRSVGIRERTGVAACGALGGDVFIEALAVLRAGPSSDDTLRVQACLRGPDLDAGKATLTSMLASIEVG